MSINPEIVVTVDASTYTRREALALALVRNRVMGRPLNATMRATFQADFEELDAAIEAHHAARRSQ